MIEMQILSVPSCRCYGLIVKQSQCLGQYYSFLDKKIGGDVLEMIKNYYSSLLFRKCSKSSMFTESPPCIYRRCTMNFQLPTYR